LEASLYEIKIPNQNEEGFLYLYQTINYPSFGL